MQNTACNFVFVYIAHVRRVKRVARWRCVSKEQFTNSYNCHTTHINYILRTRQVDKDDLCTVPQLIDTAEHCSTSTTPRVCSRIYPKASLEPPSNTPVFLSSPPNKSLLVGHKRHCGAVLIDQAKALRLSDPSSREQQHQYKS